MPKPKPKDLVVAATGYLKSHPEEILRAMRGMVGLRFGVPLDALRYMVAEYAVGKRAPEDVVIEAAPPGIRLGATVKAMGSTLRAKLKLFIEELDVSDDKALITLRIADMEIDVLDGEATPVAGLIKSGALDLSKPGNLLAYIPKRPELLVDAKDDRVVVDVLKAPKVGDNPQVMKALSVLTPVLQVAAVRSRDDHLDVHLKTRLKGLRKALGAARSMT